MAWQDPSPGREMNKSGPGEKDDRSRYHEPQERLGLRGHAASLTLQSSFQELKGLWIEPASWSTPRDFPPPRAVGWA